MKRARRIVFVFVVMFSLSNAFEDEQEGGPKEPWDIDGPCQPFIQRFADAASKMVHCSASFSSPPKVCTNCVEEYIAMKAIEYELQHLENVTSLDNTSCARVIYLNYLLSYNWEISESITRRIWDRSRCASCIRINWDLEGGKTMFSYEPNTFEFQTKLFAWRRCVTNYTADGDLTANYSSLCDNCLPSFDALFEFYWDIYITPNIDFCLDVETTMNDSMNLWHNVWQCKESKDLNRDRDWTFVMFSFVILSTVTAIFYVGSYVRSEDKQRRLVHYSTLQAPRGLRSRILSSSSMNPDEVAHSPAVPSTSTRLPLTDNQST